MSVKRSPAARVIEFFTQAPQGEAELVFGLVREVIRKRKQAADATAVKVIVHRKPRRPRVNAKSATDVVSTTVVGQPVA